MSASQTGDDVGPLVQLFIGVPNSERASAPASRTAAASRAAICDKSSTSMAGNGEALHAQGRRIGAVAEREIARGLQACEHVVQMSGNGDLAHRKSALA